MRRTTITLTTILAIGLLAGSAVGVAAQDEPVEVTGGMTWSEVDGTIETWLTSDPRLTGTGQWDPSDEIGAPRGFAYFLNGRFVETDGGTWRQLPVPTVILPGLDFDAFDLVLVGEGGYEGLVFIARATWRENGFDVQGYIVDAEAS